MMIFLSEGHEGDWTLHLDAAEANAALFPCSWLPQLCTICCTLCSFDERPQARDDEEITAWCIRSSHPRHR